MRILTSSKWVSPYGVLVVLTAFVLFIAGGAKLLLPIIARQSYGPFWSGPFLGAMEVLFGAWIVTFIWPFGTRRIAIVLFFCFFNIAVLKILEGQKSCSCFGSLSPSPVVAAGLDAFLLLGFLSFQPNISSHAATHSKSLYPFWFIPLALLLTLLFHWLPTKSAGQASSLTQSPPREFQLAGSEVETVLEGLRNNDSSLGGVTFTTRITFTNSEVKAREHIEKKLPSGATVSFTREPSFAEDFKYSIDGEKIRRKQLSDPGDIITRLNGLYTQFIPDSKRAWLRDDHASDAFPFDPHCVGFAPAVQSLEDWVSGGSPEQTPEEDEAEFGKCYTLRRVDPKMKPTTATFAKRYSYLPVRVTSYHDDGSVWSNTRIDYQSVPPSLAWFMTGARTLFWDRGVARNYKRDDAWLMKFVYAVIEKPLPLARDDSHVFDEVLPAGTVLSDARKGRNVRLNTDQAASTIRIKERVQGGHWPAIGMRVALLVVSLDCFVICLSYVLRRWLLGYAY